MARSSSSARQLNDHDEIRQWAEERGGKPACVRGTGGGDDVGMIRIDFPGYSGADSLEEISWDEWFDKFDESNLTLLVQDQTARGQKSNFNKLVSRNNAQQRSRRRGWRNGADREEGRAAARPSSSARGRSEGTRGRASSTRSRSGAKRNSKTRIQGGVHELRDPVRHVNERAELVQSHETALRAAAVAPPAAVDPLRARDDRQRAMCGRLGRDLDAATAPPQLVSERRKSVIRRHGTAKSRTRLWRSLFLGALQTPDAHQ